MNKTQRWWTIALFGAIVSVHVWLIMMAPNAFCFSQRHVHTDNAVILLMGKHILEKGEFPIFYYGQDWFGSLSAFVYAFVFWLVGIPPWSIHAVPLLFFLGYCLIVFLLAKDLWGPRVAIGTLVWNIFTPVRLSEYSVMPHGGYVEGLMLSTLVLWLCLRLVRSESRSRKTWYYAAAGLAAGIGWWTSPLVIYALAACAVFVAVREKSRCLLKGIFLTVPAFFAGSAPFFYYYAADPYSNVLNMGGGYRLAHLAGGLALVFKERIPDYLDLDLVRSMHPALFWFAAAFYAAALIFFFSKNRDFLRAASLKLLPVSFFAVFVVLYAMSIHIRRNAPQYVIPLEPFLVCVLAFWISRAGSWMKRLALAASAGVFALRAFVIITWVVHDAPIAEGRTAEISAVLEKLQRNGIRSFYVDLPPGSEIFNFYGREKLTASVRTGERYEPYQETLERQAGPVFLDDSHRSLVETMKVTGGSCRIKRVGGLQLARDFTEPEGDYLQIPPDGVRARASHETEAAGNILDRNMDTHWTSRVGKAAGMWVEFDLKRIRRVGMVRLWNKGQHHGNYALHASVQTSRDGAAWRTLIGPVQGDYYYWSGPRIYPWEWGYRWETRFGPVQARYIRIKQHEENARVPWMIAEAYLYEVQGPGAQGRAGEDEVLRRVKELGLKRVYADRWMSARLREKHGGSIETVSPFTTAMSRFYVRLKSRIIAWSSKTGFILERSDAGEFERMTRAGGIDLAVEAHGRWSLFYFRHWGIEETPLKDDRGWWWMGLGAVRTRSKEASRHAAQLALEMEKSGRMEEARRLYLSALEYYENNSRARSGLIRLLNQAGKTQEAARHEKILAEKTKPQYPRYIRFEKDVEFLGFSLKEPGIRPGERAAITYYWRLNKHIPDRQTGVFVHVQEPEGRLFQGDHRFLDRLRPIETVLDGEIFSQEEFIALPPDAAVGSYEIAIGLFDLKTGKRWKVIDTDHPHKKGRVSIGIIHVGEMNQKDREL